MSLNRLTMLVASVLLLGVMVGSSSASVISWDAAQWIAADSDVVTTGTLIQSVANVTPYTGGGSPIILNGVPFANSATGWLPDFVASGKITGPFLNPPAGLSADYMAFLDGAFYNGYSSTVSVTMSGLTAGQDYLVQVWANYCPQGNTLIGMTEYVDSSPITLNSRVDGTGPGQFIIGTFTADSTTQNFTVTGSCPAINGFQVRVVPEPCTLVLLACGLVGLMAYAWRKRK